MPLKNTSSQSKMKLLMPTTFELGPITIKILTSLLPLPLPLPLSLPLFLLLFNSHLRDEIGRSIMFFKC